MEALIEYSEYSEVNVVEFHTQLIPTQLPSQLLMTSRTQLHITTTIWKFSSEILPRPSLQLQNVLVTSHPNISQACPCLASKLRQG